MKRSSALPLPAPWMACAAVVEAKVAAGLAEGEGFGAAAIVGHDALDAGRDVLFDIDVKGVLQLYEQRRADMATIFILPPSVAEQMERLRRRATDDEATIRRRLATTRYEISHWQDFDYILINDDLDRAFVGLQAILAAERLKRVRQGLAQMVSGFRADLDKVLGPE